MIVVAVQGPPPFNFTNHFCQLRYVILHNIAVVEEQSLNHEACLRAAGRCMMQAP